jgi:hypothetical protein
VSDDTPCCLCGSDQWIFTRLEDGRIRCADTYACARRVALRAEVEGSDEWYKSELERLRDRAPA